MRQRARAVVGFVPDCAVLFARLASAGRLSRGRTAILALVGAYLASPIDLVPDFLPVIGQLDDAILVVVALRYLLRGVPAEELAAHWPGPQSSLDALLRIVSAPA